MAGVFTNLTNEGGDGDSRALATGPSLIAAELTTSDFAFGKNNMSTRIPKTSHHRSQNSAWRRLLFCCRISRIPRWEARHDWIPSGRWQNNVVLAHSKQHLPGLVQVDPEIRKRKACSQCSQGEEDLCSGGEVRGVLVCDPNKNVPLASFNESSDVNSV